MFADGVLGWTHTNACVQVETSLAVPFLPRIPAYLGERMRWERPNCRRVEKHLWRGYRKHMTNMLALPLVAGADWCLCITHNNKTYDIYPVLQRTIGDATLRLAD